MRLFCTYLVFIICNSLAAQTFSGVNGPIPDDGTGVNFPLVVNGLPTTIDTQSFGIEQVCLEINHSWSADLSVVLIAPDGSTAELFSGIGGDSDGFVGTCLNGNATVSIYEVGFPFTGVFRPLGDLGLINNGQNPNGTWQLRILDTYAFADEGTLLNWSIQFGSSPSVPFSFISSDLPIVRLSTYGQVIPDDPKIFGTMEVVDNGPGLRNYADQVMAFHSGPIGIELHGNSSLGFPKKSFRIETRNLSGEDVDVALMGMPATSDYVLSANFSDKTLLRNPLTYQLSRQMGQYATRTRFCEVLLNGAYQGVYVLTERIKRGTNRVNIAKLTEEDVSGIDLTGGYILKIDRDNSAGWFSPVSQPNSPGVYTYFQFDYPRPSIIEPEQYNYMRSYMDSFELTLAGQAYADLQSGWRSWADEGSFIDFLLINEMSKNVDGYRLSTYLHKDRTDRGGGLLKMGPVWDFDLGWYNADYCDAFLPEGWAYNLNYICGAGVPFWWERMMEDPVFRQRLSCRWQVLRAGPLHLDSIFHEIDSMAMLVEEAQQRNFKLWPILGVYIWPNPGNLPTSYAGEIQKLKTWMQQRLSWMDNTFSGFLPSLQTEWVVEPAGVNTWSFQVLNPNPALVYSWDFGDGSGAEGESLLHTFAFSGTFEVRLITATPFGCAEVVDQQVDVVVPTSPIVLSDGFMVFPNPANDRVWMTLPGEGLNLESGQVLVFNNLGQMVMKSALTTRVLDLEGLPEGRYLAVVQTGDRFWQQQLVLTRR